MNINNIRIDYITSALVLFCKINPSKRKTYYRARLIGPKISKKSMIKKPDYDKLIKRYGGRMIKNG